LEKDSAVSKGVVFVSVKISPVQGIQPGYPEKENNILGRTIASILLSGTVTISGCLLLLLLAQPVSASEGTGTSRDFQQSETNQKQIRPAPCKGKIQIRPTMEPPCRGDVMAPITPPPCAGELIVEPTTPPPPCMGKIAPPPCAGVPIYRPPKVPVPPTIQKINVAEFSANPKKYFKKEVEIKALLIQDEKLNPFSDHYLLKMERYDEGQTKTDYCPLLLTKKTVEQSDARLNGPVSVSGIVDTQKTKDSFLHVIEVRELQLGN
jgi:hypothetical protein